MAEQRLRRLLVVLGDQLDASAAIWDDADPQQDAVWMCESYAEATRVWSHKARIALFFAAMRQFADALRAQGWRVHYLAVEDHDESLSVALRSDIAVLQPNSVHVTEAGEFDIERAIVALTAHSGVPVHVHADRHFICSRDAFRHWLSGRKQPRMEHFYRQLRRRSGLLMEGGQPAGGQWNYDADNRQCFDAEGPGALPAPQAFPPDDVTRQVLALVETRFAAHPGALADFDWPVTRPQALAALQDFIEHRLTDFGRYQDAMWTGEAWLYHSRLSAALNLKLLNPLEVCAAVDQAWRQGKVPIAAAEGFVRQILGWREYVRGLYWARMPQFREENALDARAPLPEFYWTAQTGMNCLRDALQTTLQHGYAHHIQRLMVTGLYALLLGVHPRAVSDWYLAIYVDAVEWVELPNVIGMSQWADGGIMASKPYVASGNYIDRMSNLCSGCRYYPKRATGGNACPFTTLYWDFLDRHAARFATHPRMKLQVANLQRKSDAERAAIRAAAQRHRTAPERW